MHKTPTVYFLSNNRGIRGLKSRVLNGTCFDHGQPVLRRARNCGVRPKEDDLIDLGHPDLGHCKKVTENHILPFSIASFNYIIKR